MSACRDTWIERTKLSQQHPAANVKKTPSTNATNKSHHGRSVATPTAVKSEASVATPTPSRHDEQLQKQGATAGAARGP